MINGGIVDMIVEHNTVYNNTGSGPSFLHLSDQRTFAGLSWRNNILWLNRNGFPGGNSIHYGTPQFPDGTSSNSANAVTRLNKLAMRIPNPVYQFTHNAITSGDTVLEQPGYPSGNFWPGDNTVGGVRRKSHWRLMEKGPKWLKLGSAVRYRPQDVQAYLDGKAA